MCNNKELSSSNSLLNSGDILNSRYRILQKLGHGGFGRTYLAEDINRFNEPCVLKEFAPQLQGSFALSKAQELFEQEAGILYRLQHPQIPKFHELFRYKNEAKGKERLLLVQEYVEGQTYETLLNNRIKEGKVFTEAEIIQLLWQLLPVLDYIHSMGIIHRDISPDNIMLRSCDERPMLIDFGSIKEIATKAQYQLIEQDFDTENSYIMVGTIIGKTGYAPPEQMERGFVFDHSDLYALAATAVVLLTGKRPQELIDCNSYEWIWQQEVTVSPELELVLTKMLSLDMRDRFTSAIEAMEAVKELSSIKNVTPEITPIPSERPPSKNQFFPRLNLKMLFFALLTGTLLLGAFWGRNKNLVDLSQNNSAELNYQMSQRFSQGETILIPQTVTPEKELAVIAFKEGDYKKAESLFSASIKILANDPEALIYLNNARIGESKSYSIAVCIPIGSDVNAAQEILRGVAHTQNQVNQGGGIDGIPLKVQIVNDDNNPEVARQVAQNLNQNPEILGVVGHYASDVTLATAKVYESGELVAVSPISTSVNISNVSPYIFRTVPSDYIAGRALGEYMLEGLKQQNVAVYYSSQSNYSKSLKSEFATAVSLGGGMVVREFDLSDPNFSAADSFNKAMNAKAQVLMLAANTATLDKALQVVVVNRQRLIMLGGDDVYTPKTLQITGEFAEGMVLAIPWHIRDNPDAEFAQYAIKLWGGEVNWRTAMAYDAAMALITAIQSNPTRIGVQEVLSNPNFSTYGASGQVRFTPSGDRLLGIELVKIQQRKSNSFDYEFVPVAPK
ncbi:MAG: bifunctional serine/threonine-protein kinase/ABC transporter substrate-binding protein [Xenococcaceae cyanobacterium MO_207.B15]|nr:bifunctional serine/threonine-protein kinase/ABC transporter substrate-binding protein [Xenococcaceae cyanobacterium MO_207.B15]